MATDPITVSVIQHRLSGIVEEMGEAMLRTSFSQILNSSRDFSAAICAADSQLVAQADHIPIHVGALRPATQSIIETFGDDVHEGDVFVLNDPYFGGSHLPDVTVFVPIHVDGALAFWAINRAHHSDIGGATHGAYNAAAREIWQEGLRIPPMRLYDRRKLREDVMRLLKTNVRHPRDFEGDLMAQIGSVLLAERRVHAIAAEFGLATVTESVQRIIDATETRAREIIGAWPDGVYEGTAWLDDDGRGNDDVAIHAVVTIAGSDVTVDLTGSAPQVESFLNSSAANTRSAVSVAIAFLLDPDIPKNEGVSRPITVLTKPGTIVDPHPGAPVTMCTSHCADEIIEAIIVALSAACPERTPAGWGRRLRIALKGVDPRSDKPFIWHLFHARPGAGASSGGDGWHNAGELHTAGGLKFGSVEVAETRFPLFFPQNEFRPDSGGDGQYVGGAGVDLTLVVETEAPCVANMAGDGLRHGARGMLGGENGLPHRYVMRPPEGPEIELASKMEGQPTPAGARFEIRSGGGGGWGPAAKRDPEARRRDRRDGFVSTPDNEA